MTKKIPIGKDDLKEVIEQDYYYVDKTDIIEKLLSDGNYVSLFPRPRRFGKSLFISMLDNFFNIEYEDTNNNLFEGLNISKSKYYDYLSSKPVIKLDFKALKQDSYEEMYQSFKVMIRNIYLSKYYIFDNLNEIEKNIFNNYLYERASDADYKISIQMLSLFMYKYYNIKPIILIDEYDVPIERGYVKGFYDNIVKLIRNVFSNALKGNNNISFAIMTGVLRVSKESMFSDINNVEVYTINNEFYNDCFGFTPNETKELLNYYNLELDNDVKNMYDGYNFCGAEIYNPWSILNYAKYKKLEPFWINTSGNELIIKTVKNCEIGIKVLIEKLLLGELVEFIYNDKTTYQDYSDLNDSDSIFNLLLASGYLTLEKSTSKNFNIEKTYVKLPNKEVKFLFKDILLRIFKDKYRINISLIEDFCNSILENDKELMEKLLNKMLVSKSYMDNEEAYYQGYLHGIFALFINDDNYIVQSNREAGNGRFDLMIKDKKFNKGIIIELKVTDGDIEKEAFKGLNQIEEKEYYLDLINEGYKDIRKIAICFKGKSCCVR